MIYGRILQRAANSLKASFTVRLQTRYYSSTSMKTIGNSNEVSSSLPSLPVPPLADTLHRLKLAAIPFALSSQHYTEFCSLVNEFGAENKAGVKLHSLLQAKAAKSKNWLSEDWWTQKAYLEGRDSVMIWSNPAFIGPKVRIVGKDNVAYFVGKAITEALHFKQLLKEGKYPESGRICNDQYNKIYGTCRIPGETVDTIEYGDINDNNMNVVVARNNKFYEIVIPHIDLKDINNRLNVAQALCEQILHILNKNTVKEVPVGCFSSLPRSQWAKIYKKLNNESVNSIRKASFMVSLDHIDQDALFDSNYAANMGKQILHGDSRNIGNRWFDKTIQLIFVTSNGGEKLLGTGICYEHTPAEAGTVNPKRADAKLANPTLNVKSLDLIPPNNREEIVNLSQKAIDDYEAFVNTLDVDVLQFRNYGKELIKSLRLSPDSWIQVAICWAFYRMHKYFGISGACYETSSMRKFSLGRTDVIKSVTASLEKLCQEPNYTTLRAAIEQHKQLVNDVANGFGIDRIFLAFECIAKEVKEGVWKWSDARNILNKEDYELLNKLLTNEVYKESKYYRLSTSQVASRYADSFMCYGPLVKDGYGCCYNPAANQITFGLSAFQRDSGVADVHKFKSELSETLQEMNQMMLTHSKL
ncbi:carnitine O-acetyltransferase-like protein [Dinothrombium tinctorium]|uniref:Carnitine O-acetyltransferase-like protein n=1 Tax=Dinothrombium tinctorium TaxID=1965070 RepID=A0A443R8J7_9ACAR|nr:carnitine O-acetyltransferase-like protein [Dinothrombium tinctorium]